jgi:hypothetical protein
MTTLVGLTMHRKFASGEDLRQQADICRGLAGIALTERNRLFWLRLAGEWAELAMTADRRPDRRRLIRWALRNLPLRGTGRRLANCSGVRSPDPRPNPPRGPAPESPGLLLGLFFLQCGKLAGTIRGRGG